MEAAAISAGQESMIAESPSATPDTHSMVSVRLSDIQPAIDQDSRDPRVSSSASRSHSASSSVRTTSSSSSSGSDSAANDTVDWEQLDKSEEKEPRDEATDESTALLLARLEEENAALAGNPKSGLVTSARLRSKSRPLSVQKLRKLVDGPSRKSLRYSQLPAPPMTELDFWAALVADYPHTAQRLPTLTSNKIRGGVPPPLRGVVWPSIAGAGDGLLHEEYQKLSGESSPYEGLIGKDVGRSFPHVDMFREKDGEGQVMLGRVLRCFSLYDDEIGYCQGLGFVVGPLLMHMNDADAFCVLVRLMENYDLRSCYLPDLSGLHLRIYQFQQLLAQHLPVVFSHLDSLKVEPLYVSQWFLSFFAVTCPLPMLLRIYDVVLSEGATETLMRVALSLMKRNEKKILACAEFEDAMQLLLSRGLWDTYDEQEDELVTDFVSLTTVVTRDSLKSLESSFNDSKTLTVAPSLKSTASQLLGRFWTGSTHSISRSGTNLAFSLPSPSRPTSFLRRTPSKQSLSSTVNSDEGTSETSTLATEISLPLQKSDPTHSDTASIDRGNMSAKERELESQIEDLLKAMSDMQHRQNDLFSDLQREKEERQEDCDLTRVLLDSLKSLTDDVAAMAGGEKTDQDRSTEMLIAKASVRFSVFDPKRVSIVASKHQLRDEAAEWKDKHDLEAARCTELMKQLDERENEHSLLREEVREARARIQDGHKDKQRMERVINDLRTQRASAPASPHELCPSPTTEKREHRASTATTGLREFKLGRSDTLRSPVFSKRSSSLNAATMLAAENHEAVAEDTYLVDLAKAKTSEALAKQELEEVKSKLEALKKIVGGSTMAPSASAMRRAVTVDTNSPPPPPQDPTSTGPGSAVTPSKRNLSSSAGGFFSGWGKRAATTYPS